MAETVVAAVVGAVVALTIAGVVSVVQTARDAMVRAVMKNFRRDERPTAQRLADMYSTLQIALVAISVVILVSYGAAPISKDWRVALGVGGTVFVLVRVLQYVGRSRGTPKDGDRSAGIASQV